MKLILFLLLLFPFHIALAQSLTQEDSLVENNDSLAAQNISTKDSNVIQVNLDSTIQKSEKVAKAPYIKQIRFGLDIARIGFNFMFPSRQAYEFQGDYALRNNLYIAAETGFGKGKIDYKNLKYTTSAYFIRLGLDKSFLDRIGLEDFDMGFLGFRYGMGIGQISDVNYTLTSPFGTIIQEAAPGQTFVAHWGEIVGGIKVELWSGIFAGWTGRGKFIFNPGVFKEVSPNFIPGYGKGDKKSVLDFNFYVSYSIRWGKEKIKEEP